MSKDDIIQELKDQLRRLDLAEEISTYLIAGIEFLHGELTSRSAIDLAVTLLNRIFPNNEVLKSASAIQELGARAVDLDKSQRNRQVYAFFKLVLSILDKVLEHQCVVLEEAGKKDELIAVLKFRILVKSVLFGLDTSEFILVKLTSKK